MKRLIEKLFIFLALMMVSVMGNAQTWTWTGETPAAGGSYYLYNVGFKGFLNYTGSVSVTENNTPNTLWEFSSATSGTISTSYNNSTYYVYVEKTWNAGDASIRTNSATVTIATSSITSGAYKIQHTKTGIGSGTRYFNVENSTKITAASTNGVNNDWYLITEAQKSAYDTYFSTYSALYTTAKEYNAQNSKLSDDVKSALAGVISDYASVNWKNVEAAIAALQSEKVTNAKTEIDTYDANIVEYNKAKTTAQAYVNNPLISDEINNKLTTALAVSVNGKNIEQTIADLNAAIEAAKAALDSILPYDASEKIINPDANDGTNGWTANEYATFQVAANGSFEVASWGIANASMTQTVTGLPNGYYVLQTSQMAPVGKTVELWGNNSSNTYTATTQEFRDLGVVCLVTDGTLTIKAVNNNEGAWSNFDNFTLKYYGIEEPDLTYYVGEKIDGTYLNQQPVYTGADESKTALLIISYVDNYTNDPKHPYTIKEGAQATVETRKGSQQVEIKPDPTPYNENSFAIYIENFDETETYKVTIPAGSYGYIGEPGGTNEEIYLEAVQSPLHDGKYFVVVKGTGKHVSRGKGWGTQAILDYYGVPMTVQTSGQTVFRFLDSNAFMGSGPNDDWMYTDKQESQVKEIRRYILVPGTGEHEGEYMFYNPIRKKYLYHGIPENESYDAIFEGDEGAWFQFEALVEDGYGAHLAKIEEDEAIRVAARAGFVVKDITEYDALINQWETEGYSTIFPEESNDTQKAAAKAYHEKKNGELACAIDWAGTPRDLVGGDKVSLSLDKGLYVMYCDAFQQAMALSTLKANQGFRGLTYMYVKVGSEMYKSQLKSITETTGTIPTDEASATTALDAGTYRNQVIFYVPADGTTVEFGVENPQRLGNGVDETAGSWVAFKNIKVEKFNAELAEANMKITAGKYGTFIAPFAVKLPAGVTAYTGTLNGEKTSVALTSTATEGTELAACTPVIVKNDGETDVDMTYREVDVRDNKTTVTEQKGVLVGFYKSYAEDNAALITGDGNSWVLQTQNDKQAFYMVEPSKTFKGSKNRCYLVAPAGAGVKVLDFEFADEESAIESLANGATIVEYYSVNGSKLSAPWKGINLVKMSDSTVKKIFVK